MTPIAGQVIDTQQKFYFQTANAEMEKPLKKEKERLINREELLQNIAFLTQYMEDLKTGRPVENISPSNDPYFLVPENIASMIRGEKDILAGRVRTINSIKDIVGEWDI